MPAREIFAGRTPFRTSALHRDKPIRSAPPSRIVFALVAAGVLMSTAASAAYDFVRVSDQEALVERDIPGPIALLEPRSYARSQSIQRVARVR